MIKTAWRAATAALLLLILAGCGLPSYNTLSAPSVVSYGSANQVGFTASGGSGVSGYIIYYKIYYYNDSLARSEEQQFEESYYDNSSGSGLPNGDTLPKNLGFRKMGFVDRSSIATPQIEYTGSGVVRLDFSGCVDQTVNSDPVLYIADSNSNSSVGIPARGVKYSDNSVGSSAYQSNSTYKRFVRNYEYDGNNDADISQALSRGGEGITNIEIAFVAISYGLDSTTLVSSMSIPVYLGTVTQNNFSDNSSNSPQ